MSANPLGEEFENLADFAKLFHAWTLRSFSQDDLPEAQPRLYQLWRTLGRSIGGNDVLRRLESEPYDPTYVPGPIKSWMMQMVRNGATDNMVAYWIRAVMPQLIMHYFPNRTQAWYYVEGKNYPTPYPFGAPITISNPNLEVVRTARSV